MNHKTTLTILSPLHIGAGTDKTWQRGTDFVQHGGNIYRLKVEDVFQLLSEPEQAKYLSKLASGKAYDVERFLIDSIDIEQIASSVFEYDTDIKSNTIQPLIRDGNNLPYLPGSSIKGAIASGILHFLYNGIKPAYYNDITTKELLGDMGRALGRYIRPSDSNSLTETEISDIELYNLYREGMDWEGDYKDGSGFPMMIETFKPNASVMFRLSFAENLAAFIKQESQKSQRVLLPTYYEQVLGENPQKTLFNILNNYAITHLENELQYFKKYNNLDDIDEVIAKLEDLQLMAKNADDKTCILRMSYGSGFHGITGDWRFKDHTQTIKEPDIRNLVFNQKTRNKEPARYKSRRLAFPFLGAMGFVKLNITN